MELQFFFLLAPPEGCLTKQSWSTQVVDTSVLRGCSPLQFPHPYMRDGQLDARAAHSSRRRIVTQLRRENCVTYSFIIKERRQLFSSILSQYLSCFVSEHNSRHFMFTEINAFKSEAATACSAAWTLVQSWGGNKYINKDVKKAVLQR